MPPPRAQSAPRIRQDSRPENTAESSVYYQHEQIRKHRRGSFVPCLDGVKRHSINARCSSVGPNQSIGLPKRFFFADVYVQAPEAPGLVGLRLGVNPLPQLLQTDGRLYQSERIQAELAMIASNLDTAIARIREESGAAATGRGWFASLLEIVEGFLEPGDSVRRRKTADRIYRDVVAERISSTRAEVELKSLTQRQKGGWLARAVEGLRRKLGNGATPSELPRLAETRKETVRT